eukprot:4481679-Amphidinium_carterae.1
MFWLRAQARLHTWKRHIPARVMEALKRIEETRLPIRPSSQEKHLINAYDPVDPLEAVVKKNFEQQLLAWLASALVAGAVCVVMETFSQEGKDEGAKAEDPQHKDASHRSFQQKLMLRVQANIPSEET